MNTKNKILTSESVTIGHPDKISDYIADSILDAILKEDKDAHVACEVTCAYNKVNIFGEITTVSKVDYEAVARKAIREVGYTKDEYLFTDKCDISVNLHTQSPEINQGVQRENGDIGAGDQGFMFGYATNECPNLMPYGIDLAHKLSKELTKARRADIIKYLRPDGKTQATISYDKNGKVDSIETIVISTQTDEDVELETLKKDLLENIIYKNVDKSLLKNTKLLINPTGKFCIGGPAADSGLTGRKLMVDTYGSYSHHGGGSFAGKDPTKVDRSAAYMLRRIAKNIVFHKLADKVELQVSYSIGVSEPVSFCIDTFGTGKYPDSKIIEKIKSFYSLKPGDVIDFLELKKPQYALTNDGGSFGNDLINPLWEKIDENF